MNGEAVEIQFLDILRKTCRTMRQSRTRPEMAIPAAEWEIKINERLQELTQQQELALPKGKKEEVHA